MKDPFRSDRLIYRAIELSDDAFIHKICSDARGFALGNVGLLRPASKKWSQSLQNFVSDSTLLGAMICLPASPSTSTTTPETPPASTPIGFIFLTKPSNENAHHRNADLGIHIIEGQRGKGYGTEAIKWVLNWAFRMAGLHRVQLSVFEWNENARKVYERCGFMLEGRKRESLWFDGRWWDGFEFGMLEGEWREKGEAVGLLE
jgi:RimJ/RimL family protein N-acetyltransferase